MHLIHGQLSVCLMIVIPLVGVGHCRCDDVNFLTIIYFHGYEYLNI